MGHSKEMASTETEVYWLLEELSNLEGEELSEAVRAARAAVIKPARSNERALSRAWSTATIDENPVCVGASQFVGSRAVKVPQYKMPTIDELRKRLLNDETVEDESPRPSAFGPSTEVEIEDGFDEAGQRAVDLLCSPEGSSPLRRGALVKTIKNDHWRTFGGLLARVKKKHKPYYTPTSLPPVGCVGMRLFGRVWAQSCGIVLDRAALDLPDDVWAWRAGFFAKTEFGVTSKTTADKTLRPDLQAALASLEDLEEMAAKREYEHFGTRKVADDVTPYNEVFAPLKIEGVVAVFARTTQVSHLLLAMGARDLLQRLTDRKIGLLVVDASGTQRPRVVSVAAQAEIVRRVAESSSFHSTTPLAVDTRSYGLDSDASLAFHAAHSLTDDALKEALACDRLVDVGRRAELAVRAAIAPERNNPAAAEAVVRVFAAFVLDKPPTRDVTVFQLPAPEVIDDDCLRAAGAFACLAALVSGRLAWAAQEALDLLDDWLHRAEASLAFRVSSWRDASRHNDGASFAAFAGKKAIQNRAAFRDKLANLAPKRDNDESHDHALGHLTALVVSCHAPCLRLELLQFLIGLDARWGRDLLLHTCELARDALADTNSYNPLISPNSDSNLSVLASVAPVSS